MINVGICDDDDISLKGVASILSRDPDIEVVHLVETRDAALAAPGPVDVWLLDVAMPGLSAAETCRRLREGKGHPAILMITAFPDGSVTDAMKAGASGYLYKDVRPAHLLHAVKSAAQGLSVSSPEAISALLDEPLLGRLSPDLYGTIVLDEDDERVVELVLEGHAVEAMAAKLGLSESGFKKRLGRIMHRAGVATRPLLMARLYAARAARDEHAS
ncbi:MAG: response regulator transcription factor [Arachnia sp.]